MKYVDIDYVRRRIEEKLKAPYEVHIECWEAPYEISIAVNSQYDTLAVYHTKVIPRANESKDSLVERVSSAVNRGINQIEMSAFKIAHLARWKKVIEHIYRDEWETARELALDTMVELADKAEQGGKPFKRTPWETPG